MDNNKLFQVEKTSKGYSITLSGDLTLATTAKIKSQLEAYVDKKECLNITANQVEGIDLGIYQLMQSLIWTRKQKNEETKVSITLPTELQQLTDNCGITLRY